MTLATFAEPLTYWLIAVNFVAFAAFGLDKARAEAGGWRIGEGALLALAWAGGTLGAYAGRAMFRHKTRKASFSRRLDGVAGMQGAGAALLLVAATGLAEQPEAGAERPGELDPAVAALVADAPAPPTHDPPIDDTPSGLGLAPDVTFDDAGVAGWTGAEADTRAPYRGLRLVGCDAVRAAGRAPLTRGDPDYHPAMDRDGDGIACEPVKERAR